ncbi:MAG: major capsid protein [Paraclostridium sp.]
MIHNFDKVFNSASFVGYVQENMPILGEATELEGLFPVRVMEGLDYSYIKTKNGAVELTAPSAFDAEPIAQHREGFDAMKGEMPLFRKKMNMSEKEYHMLNLYLRSADDQGVARLLTQIFDDQATLVSGAVMTQEFLRSRALMDGKITINSKGGAVSVDYKVPSAQKLTLSGASAWTNADLDITGQITGWLDAVEDRTGIRPTRMLMNRNTFKLLRNNKQIKAMSSTFVAQSLAGLAGSAVVNDVAIMNGFKSLTGLTDVMVYNKKVQMDGALLDLIEDNKIVIFPEGELGNTMVGTSPAEMHMADANKSGSNITVMGNGFAVNTYTNTKAPYTSGTEIEFVGLPSLTASEFIVQAKVA